MPWLLLQLTPRMGCRAQSISCNVSVSCNRTAIAATIAAVATTAAAAPWAAPATHELQRLAPQQRPQLLQLHLVVPQAATCTGDSKRAQSSAKGLCRAELPSDMPVSCTGRHLEPGASCVVNAVLRLRV